MVAITALVIFAICNVCRASKFPSSHADEVQDFPTPKHQHLRSSGHLNRVTNVTVIIAQSSSIKEKQCILENVVKELDSYESVEVHWYDKTEGGVAAWVETRIRMSQKVLLVCNQAFIKEWEKPNEDMILNGAIVHAVKQYIQGDINFTENYCKKYGLVFLKVRDLKDIPGGYLKNCTKFVVDPGNPAKEEEMVHFVIGVGKYTLLSKNAVLQ